MLAQPRLGQNPAHGPGHGLGSIWRDQQGILSVFQQIRNTPNISTDDTKPAGHGLYHAYGSIVHLSRIQENISFFQPNRDFLFGNGAEEFYQMADPGCGRRGFGLSGPSIISSMSGKSLVRSAMALGARDGW